MMEPFEYSFAFSASSSAALYSLEDEFAWKPIFKVTSFSSAGADAPPPDEPHPASVNMLTAAIASAAILFFIFFPLLKIISSPAEAVEYIIKLPMLIG